MKTYNEWLTDRDDSDGDESLVDEQTAMIMQRFIGLLHGIDPKQKTAIVERAIKELSDLI